MENKFVSAIIVTYDPDVNVLGDLIESLEKQIDTIIVVDNFSKNISSIESVEKKFKLIKLERNIGLASAQNIGIREAYNSSSHIIIFDQDSEISNDFVSNQLKCESLLLSRGIKVSAVGPKFFDKDSGYEYPATIYKGPFIKKIPVIAEPVEATFVIASGSLMRTEVLKDVGLMLDDFFIDFVDVEWCLRASSKGYKCFINPFESMKHSIGDLRIDIFGRMISLHSDFRKFYIYRNGLYMTRLSYVPFWYKIRVFIFNLIRTGIGIILSKQKGKTIKASFNGWKNGFGRFNKTSPL
ncbi:glycosyltransferase family 2 protein [Klebsiella michiganensis]|uniref:glycosyltransferase family 2 protein n=1 Tax=Klebsiella michiganensis TaxID=1134687 RepID=UPI002448946B|nr:glycosyltransferase family 2 protein [Klebsiella michiganensis]MDH1758927.1 glycosyltransferase family 2 protein [Klebsiella michiganensis]